MFLRAANAAFVRAFAEGARSAAQLFDIAADPLNRERMTYTSPTSCWNTWRRHRGKARPRDRRLRGTGASGRRLS